MADLKQELINKIRIINLINGIIVGLFFAIIFATMVEVVIGLVAIVVFGLILPLAGTALYRISIWGYDNRNLTKLGFFDKINLILFSFIFLIPATFVIIGKIDEYLSADAQDPSAGQFDSYING